MFSMSSASKYLGSFDFSMKTSSGDKVELSAYNRQESDLKTTKDKNLELANLTIKEEFGYRFSYDGNGIDAQDKKEIEDALKKMEPLLKIFQNSNFKPSNENATNLSFNINSFLPIPKDENHKSFMKESTLDKLDEMIDAFKAADDMREFAKDVFDMLELQMEGMRVYA